MRALGRGITTAAIGGDRWQFHLQHVTRDADTDRLARDVALDVASCGRWRHAQSDSHLAAVRRVLEHVWLHRRFHLVQLRLVLGGVELPLLGALRLHHVGRLREGAEQAAQP